MNGVPDFSDRCIHLLNIHRDTPQSVCIRLHTYCCAIDHFTHTISGCHGFFQTRTALLGRLVHLTDKLAHICKLLIGIIRQLPHLVCNNREALAKLTRARCLDGSIQCEKICLSGDRLHLVNDLIDLTDQLHKPGHLFCHDPHIRNQLILQFLCIIQQPLTFFCLCRQKLCIIIQLSKHDRCGLCIFIYHVQAGSRFLHDRQIGITDLRQ